MKNSKAKKTAYYGMYVALAFVFSYIEVLMNFSIGVYGVKIGLANVVVLTALYAMGPKEAFVISWVRILLVSFTFGNLYGLLYSLVGGLLSFAIMWLLKNIKGFSMIGVSIAGGIAHNVGQIIVAILVLETVSIGYYLPVLLISGTITGVFTGILGIGLLKVQKGLK